MAHPPPCEEVRDQPDGAGRPGPLGAAGALTRDLEQTQRDRFALVRREHAQRLAQREHLLMDRRAVKDVHGMIGLCSHLS